MGSVRHALQADLPVLVALGRVMHAEAPRMRFTHFDGEKVAKVLLQVMQTGLVLVHLDVEGVIDGGFAGVLTERWYAPERTFGDLALFVRPDRRGGLTAYRLIREALRWCKAQGLRPEDVTLGVSTGIHPEQTGKLYVRLGFERVGGIYALRGY